MASAPAAGRRGRGKKPEDQHLTAIGYIGRATGLQVPEDGPLDVNGFEDPQKFFKSSPLARSVKSIKSTRPARISNSTIYSDDMEVAHSSAPEISEALSGRASFRSRRDLPPTPRARPQMRTSLGQTPRRDPTISPRKSEARSQLSPASLARRRLDFSIEETRQSIEGLSPRRTTSNLNLRHSTAHQDIDPFDIPRDSPEIDPRLKVWPIEYVQEQDEERQQDIAQDHLNNYDYGDAAPQFGDDEEFEDYTTRDQVENGAQEEHEARPRTLELGNISGNSDGHVSEEGLSQIEEEQEESEDRSAPRRTTTHNHVQNDENENENVGNGSILSDGMPPLKRKRGRPPKAVAVTTASQQSKKSKPPLSRKDPNRRSPSAYSEDGSQRGVRVGGQRLRSETPATDDGTKRTRTGRILMKPMKFWQNERVEYEPHSENIKQILRAEEITPQKKKYPSKQKRKRPVLVDDEDEDDDIEAEDSMMEDGVITRDVQVWDTSKQELTTETTPIDIAYAADRLEARSGADAAFAYSKFFTMPFIGSGVVTLPPHGYKRVKNSRRMHIVFFVHQGKVKVKVADDEFSIAKKGMWQIPRGHWYGMTNETDQEVVLFFTQGCEVLDTNDMVEQQ